MTASRRFRMKTSDELREKYCGISYQFLLQKYED